MNEKAQRLNSIISAVERDIPIGSYWRHYKGGVYMVMGCSFHSEDQEPLVLYMRVAGVDYDPEERCIMFARPAKMWTENDRFKLIDKVTTWSDMVKEEQNA